MEGNKNRLIFNLRNIKKNNINYNNYYYTEAVNKNKILLADN